MARPGSLEEELAALSAEHRELAEASLAVRALARVLAFELSLDESDVYHQLQQLNRSPSARLRLGLAHGRLRPRLAY
jgi:hypothetical protein